MGGISSVYSSSIYNKIYLVLLVAFGWHQSLNIWFNRYTTVVNILKVPNKVKRSQYMGYYYPSENCSEWNKGLLEYIYYVGITDKKLLDASPESNINFV